MPATISCDVAIAGGGLAGSLIALALAARRPELDVRIVEGGRTLGGNHVWSLFGSDVADADRWLIAPLISHGWTGYDIAFPAHSRGFEQSYYSIESERLDQVVRAQLPPERVLTKRKILAASPTAIVLANGDRVVAKGVIDARGPGDLALIDCGWQKFVGRAFELSEPHELARPVVMDATVAQLDGYRFVYLLPLSATEIFVEDTYYSDAPELDVAAVSARIDDYVAAKGWSVLRETRTEAGVLPVAIAGDFHAYWQSGGNKVAKAGMRAGLFHPTTGYSLPDAVRLAGVIANAPDVSGAALHALTHDYARAAWRRRWFYRRLDAMLFRAAQPHERYKVLERFYRLSPALIRRFYAGRTTMADMARVVTGKPPVPLMHGFSALFGGHPLRGSALEKQA
ncbi:MAG: lycopene beta-cyclase CrtY [Pseudomonadota bacterium]